MAMFKSKRNESGVAMIEGALTAMLWISLLLGTLFFGSEFVQALQVVQVDRDAGHMYARGVNPSTDPTNSNQILIARLGYQLGLATFDTNWNVTGVNTTGPMVVILTGIQVPSATACTLVDPNEACTNKDLWVVTSRVIVGNSGLRGSNYTQDPLPAAELDPSTGIVTNKSVIITVAGKPVTYTFPYYLTDARLQLKNFNLIPCSPATLTTGLPEDTAVYMAEAFLQTPGVPTFIGSGGIYSADFF
jgi:Flp pilus assembly protein TadG